MHYQLKDELAYELDKGIITEEDISGYSYSGTVTFTHYANEDLIPISDQEEENNECNE